MAKTRSPVTKFSTYANQVSLSPGEQLHFQPGKGYFAGPKIGHPAQVNPAPDLVSENGRWTRIAPKAPAPTPPPPITPHVAVRPPVDPYAPRTQAQIDAEAAKQAHAALDPQTAEVQRQADLAARRAAADELALKGFTGAAAEMLKGLGEKMSAPYTAAAGEVGDLARGFTGGIADRMSAGEGANEDFARSQGVDYSSTADPAAQGNVGYDLNGFIPGASLAKQGAAAGAFGASLPAVQEAAGLSDFRRRQAESVQEQGDYAQQMIALAKQFPQLRDEAMKALQQYEIDKANYRETRRVNSANIANAAADNRRQERALRDNERAAGLNAKTDAAKTAAEYTYKYAALRLRSQEDATKIKQAQAEGHRIDAAASKVVGHVVYKDGSEDPSIKVAKQAGASKDMTQYQRAQMVAKANADAISLRGKPVAVAAALGAPGKYVAARDQKYNVPGGVFPPDPDGFYPATTNDPKRAQRDGSMTFAQAQAHLASAYGITPKRARAILIANGWKPDGKRP